MTRTLQKPFLYLAEVRAILTITLGHAGSEWASPLRHIKADIGAGRNTCEHVRKVRERIQYQQMGSVIPNFGGRRYSNAYEAQPTCNAEKPA